MKIKNTHNIKYRLILLFIGVNLNNSYSSAYVHTGLSFLKGKVEEAKNKVNSFIFSSSPSKKFIDDAIDILYGNTKKKINADMENLCLTSLLEAQTKLLENRSKTFFKRFVGIIVDTFTETDEKVSLKDIKNEKIRLKNSLETELNKIKQLLSFFQMNREKINEGFSETLKTYSRNNLSNMETCVSSLKNTQEDIKNLLIYFQEERECPEIRKKINDRKNKRINSIKESIENICNTLSKGTSETIIKVKIKDDTHKNTYVYNLTGLAILKLLNEEKEGSIQEKKKISPIFIELIEDSLKDMEIDLKQKKPVEFAIDLTQWMENNYQDCSDNQINNLMNNIESCAAYKQFIDLEMNTRYVDSEKDVDNCIDKLYETSLLEEKIKAENADEAKNPSRGFVNDIKSTVISISRYINMTKVQDERRTLEKTLTKKLEEIEKVNIFYKNKKNEIEIYSKEEPYSDLKKSLENLKTTKENITNALEYFKEKRTVEVISQKIQRERNAKIKSIINILQAQSHKAQSDTETQVMNVKIYMNEEIVMCSLTKKDILAILSKEKNINSIFRELVEDCLNKMKTLDIENEINQLFIIDLKVWMKGKGLHLTNEQIEYVIRDIKQIKSSQEEKIPQKNIEKKLIIKLPLWMIVSCSSEENSSNLSIENEEQLPKQLKENEDNKGLVIYLKNIFIKNKQFLMIKLQKFIKTLRHRQSICDEFVNLYLNATVEEQNITSHIDRLDRLREYQKEINSKNKKRSFLTVVKEIFISTDKEDILEEIQNIKSILRLTLKKTDKAVGYYIKNDDAIIVAYSQLSKDLENSFFNRTPLNEAVWNLVINKIIIIKELGRDGRDVYRDPYAYLIEDCSQTIKKYEDILDVLEKRKNQNLVVIILKMQGNSEYDLTYNLTVNFLSSCIKLYLYMNGINRTQEFKTINNEFKTLNNILSGIILKNKEAIQKYLTFSTLGERMILLTEGINVKRKKKRIQINFIELVQEFFSKEYINILIGGFNDYYGAVTEYSKGDVSVKDVSVKECKKLEIMPIILHFLSMVRRDKTFSQEQMKMLEIEFKQYYTQLRRKLRGEIMIPELKIEFKQYYTQLRRKLRGEIIIPDISIVIEPKVFEVSEQEDLLLSAELNSLIKEINAETNSQTYTENKEEQERMKREQEINKKKLILVRQRNIAYNLELEIQELKNKKITLLEENKNIQNGNLQIQYPEIAATKKQTVNIQTQTDPISSSEYVENIGEQKMQQPAEINLSKNITLDNRTEENNTQEEINQEIKITAVTSNFEINNIQSEEKKEESYEESSHEQQPQEPFNLRQQPSRIIVRGSAYQEIETTQAQKDYESKSFFSRSTRSTYGKTINIRASKGTSASRSEASEEDTRSVISIPNRNNGYRPIINPLNIPPLNSNRKTSPLNISSSSKNESILKLLSWTVTVGVVITALVTFSDK
jgi:hypothetical protein